jgi:Helicase associated domain
MVSWEERFAIFASNKEKGIQGQPAQKTWEQRQRSTAKRGNLSALRKGKLGAAGFDFGPQESLNIDDETWKENFELLKEYKLKEGNCSVPRNSPKLYFWACNQRRYLIRQAGLSERMKGRRALLIQLGFWDEIGNIECDDSDTESEYSRVVGDANPTSNDSAKGAPVINGTQAARVAPAQSPGDEQNGQRQNLNRADVGADCTDISAGYDSSRRHNNASGDVPVIHGTGVDTIMALWPGGRQSDQRFDLTVNRAQNSRLTARHSTQPLPGFASTVETSVLAARTPPPNQSKAASYESEVEKSAPIVEKSLFDTSLLADIHALNAEFVFAIPSHSDGATYGTGVDKDSAVIPVSCDPPGVACDTGLDTSGVERNDQRQNESLKRAGTKPTDRHGKQPRLVSVSCLHGRASAEAAGTGAGAPLQPSGDGEDLGGEILLDSVLQSSKIFKDARSKLAKKCQGLVTEMNRLDTEAIVLYYEMKRANPSMKSNVPENHSALDSEVSALVDRASTDEHHGNCAVKATAWFDSLYVDLRKASELHQQLVDCVKQQESELASRYGAFEAWKAKSKALSKELADIEEKRARLQEEQINHNDSL